MVKVAFYGSKIYDKDSLEAVNQIFKFEIYYFIKVIPIGTLFNIQITHFISDLEFEFRIFV